MPQDTVAFSAAHAVAQWYLQSECFDGMVVCVDPDELDLWPWSSAVVTVNNNTNN